MKLRSLLLAAALIPGPALAQHAGHEGHSQSAEGPAADPQAEHAEQPGRVDKDAPVDPAADAQAHEGHDAPAPDRQEPSSDAHTERQTSGAAAQDPHAGHVTPSSAEPPVAGPPPEAFTGPENAADNFFGNSAMEQARRKLGREHGDRPAYRILIDRLEARVSGGRDQYLFDGQAWYGGDIDKLWLKAEGHGTFAGKFEGAELQALWSHAIGPWFDLQTGVRYDAGPGADTTYVVAGVQGLAPYWIEVDAAAFLSGVGDVTARVEAEHDLRITQRLIMQPRAEIEFALQDIPTERTGSGVVSAALGARLRYQETPLLAPYVGAEYETTFGQTRAFRRASGDDPDSLAFIAGIRAWF